MLSVDDAHRLIAQHLGGDAARAIRSAAVALLMRQMAERAGADPTLWEITGLCHDLDFVAVAGQWPRHGLLTAEWLRDDLPVEALNAIRAHDHRTGSSSTTVIAKALKLADALVVARDHLGPTLADVVAGGLADELRSALAPREYLASMIETNSAALGIALPSLASLVGSHVAVLGSATPHSPGFAQLRDESVAQGHRMLLRCEENWKDGSNRFDQRGEMVFGVFSETSIIGLCGRNRDPYDRSDRAGRVRHLYVARAHRKSGLGRVLIERVVADAGNRFDYLNTNCPPDAAGFYEHLGFVPMPAPNVTHRLLLRR